MDNKMNENKIEERKIMADIRQSAEDIEIPKNLSPENILKKLKEQQKSSSDTGCKEKIRKKTPWRKYCVRLVESAAVLILAFVAVNQMEGVKLSKTVGESMVEDSQAEEVQVEEVQVEEGNLKPVGTSAELFQKLWDYRNIQMVSGALWGRKTLNYEYEVDMAEDAEIAPMYDSAADSSSVTSKSMDAADAGDFSQTNLREAGVDEGDVVKTDGDYLYIMKKKSSVKIVRIDGGDMETVSSIEPGELDESILDMYLDDDKLILVTMETESEMDESKEDVYAVRNYFYTKVYTYDLSDRSNPTVSGCVEQEGYYRSSRKSGDYIYLFTEFEPQLEKTEDQSRIMPLVAGEDVPAEKIYVPEVMENSRYLVIASVDINDPSNAVDSAAVVSGADNFYVSKDSIFICNEKWDSYRDNVTHIMKFSYKDGEITGVAAGQVEGYLNDTFSLDEYKGYLRLVTTGFGGNDEINSLYVLDGQLEIVGKIDDIAPGETIRSARFMGDTGYFVTFRQTDPLFSVDLTEPDHPRILGELKVTGFSSYLHFYGENRLLGIGYEADEDTGITNGIKISMFDISDPSDVKESSRYVVKDASYCPGLYDYKAIMIDVSKNLFGFVCDGQYMVFSYDEEEGFVNELTYKLEEEKDGYWYSHETDRGLYVQDTFYLAATDMVLAFDMTESFELIGKLEWN